MTTEKQIKDNLEFAPNLTYCIKQWEKIQYEWARDEHDGLRKAELEGAERINEYPVFQREHFSRLVGGVSKVKEPTPESAWAERIHNTLDELPEWQTLKQRCRNDEYAAACATVGFSKRIIEMLPSHSENAQEARELRDLLQEDLTNGELTDLESLANAEQRLQKAIEESQNTANNFDPSALRQAARSAIDSTNKELDNLDDAMNQTGWGQDSTQSKTRQGAQMKAKVAGVLRDSRKLSAIMQMAGRMQNIWKDVKASRPDKGASEITDIEIGANLDRLLPSESVAMMHPSYKMLLWRKLTERSAMQYQLADKKPEGRGPIIVCVDDSGSMEGDREVWAKGLALGLMLKARDQKRAFAYCTFSTEITSAASETVSKRMSPVEILQALEIFTGGGTRFEPPLTWALDQIEKSDELNKADVVFISDGSCLHSDIDKLRQRKDSLGCRIWGIAVGPDAIGHTVAGSMNSFCEKVWPVSEAVPGVQNNDEMSAVTGVMSV